MNRIQLLDRLELQDKICAEVGVLHGDFSAEILKRKPSELYLIDPWAEQDTAEYNDLNNHKQSKFDDIYHGVTARFRAQKNVTIFRTYSHHFAREFRPMTLDFVYLDGNHSYQGVLADLCMFWPMIRTGGWICGHDYQSAFIGVEQAVISFCQITGLTVDVVTDDAPWRSFAIRVKERS